MLAVTVGGVVTACTGDAADDAGGGAESGTTGPATQGDPTQGDPTQGDPTQGDPTQGEGTTSGTTGTVDTTAGTGGVELCGVGDADGPGFDLLHEGAAVPARNASINVVCGVQGAFMLNFDVSIVGVDTMGSDEVPFDVTIDVGDYDITDGHFMDRSVPIYVGCQDDFQSDPTQFNLVIPDEILDPAELGGQPLSLQFVMLPGTPQEVSFSASGTLSTEGSRDWAWCYGGVEEGTSTGDESGTSTGGSDTGGATGTTGG